VASAASCRLILDLLLFSPAQRSRHISARCRHGRRRVDNDWDLLHRARRGLTRPSPEARLAVGSLGVSARGAARAMRGDLFACGDPLTWRDGQLEPGVVVPVAAHAVQRRARGGAAQLPRREVERARFGLAPSAGLRQVARRIVWL
jgi:hypothetical protein